MKVLITFLRLYASAKFHNGFIKHICETYISNKYRTCLANSEINGQESQISQNKRVLSSQSCVILICNYIVLFLTRNLEV